VVANEATLLRQTGCEVEQLTIGNEEASRLPNWRAGAKAVWNVQAERALGALIDDFRPDVVHVHTPFPLMSPAVFRAAGRRRIPAIATMHSFRYSCIKGTCYRNGSTCELCIGKTLNLPGIRYRCYKNSVLGSGALATSLALHKTVGTFSRYVKKFIVLTNFSRDLLVRDGYPRERVVVKANSVPDPGYVDQPPDSYAIFVGRLEEEKGIDTLLDAWSGLGPAHRLLIVGDGTLRSVVEQAAAQNTNVEFLGWQPPERVQNLLAHARVLVLPSKWYEAGFPLVAIESYASGTPVLMSDLANLREAIKSETIDLRFQAGDAQSLLRAVGRCWNSVTSPETRRRARHQYEVYYSQTRNKEDLVAIYSSTMSSPHGAGTTGEEI
jgi:glycosyltransferase involved in cell wall biosynthesis